MLLPDPVGPLSRRAHALLRGAHRAPGPLELPEAGSFTEDLDAQLALWLIHQLSYRGYDDVDDDLEWSPAVVTLRRGLESAFEAELRSATRERLAVTDAGTPVEELLLAMVAVDDGPSVAAYLHRHATREHVLDYLRERSVQQLAEADAQSFMLPRLRGAAKVALAEIQYDEYGAGRADRLHQDLYARTMRGAGLDDSWGAYLPDVGATSLALANLPSMLALNRRLVPAGAGHFAVFEASSSVPSRKIAAGIERVGLGPEVAAYFDEHVEADAVHEQVAARDLCGSLVVERPELRSEVLFGAACCLHLDRLAAEELLGRWGASDDRAERAG
ncbi:hypothetical protein GCM10011519_24750 [Marmoricola endophyticus]|uniref:Iron-containing redox enzyme family protein n=2 Tax=Marmoricola endophyticus TaxID=2040280 RepID=A0A917BMM9_9ACTN|nr:hypothetical protein GCM10011519_24750 [Marmoricola endophyticus]